ncbi:hypothetical protein EVAR_21889_1 [Eumeta japonica]|uniref:Uncharacterized protein n=1 Tax=Eumeta variegata TaxID=151549 RepID=A0A4C2A6P8_EUMVA|nr:hypothetical protein EVAR_21889_1 [Eumeta japonica]
MEPALKSGARPGTKSKIVAGPEWTASQNREQRQSERPRKVHSEAELELSRSPALTCARVGDEPVLRSISFCCVDFSPLTVTVQTKGSITS